MHSQYRYLTNIFIITVCHFSNLRSGSDQKGPDPQHCYQCGVQILENVSKGSFYRSLLKKKIREKGYAVYLLY
jgi:hypothetical protein